MVSLEELTRKERNELLRIALDANDYETVALIIAINELCLEQQEKQPSKKKLRQTRRISSPFWQTLTPILESHLE